MSNHIHWFVRLLRSPHVQNIGYKYEDIIIDRDFFLILSVRVLQGKVKLAEGTISEGSGAEYSASEHTIFFRKGFFLTNARADIESDLVHEGIHAGVHGQFPAFQFSTDQKSKLDRECVAYIGGAYFDLNCTKGVGYCNEPNPTGKEVVFSMAEAIAKKVRLRFIKSKGGNLPAVEALDAYHLRKAISEQPGYKYLHLTPYPP
jgi:hypothetical protein